MNDFTKEELYAIYSDMTMCAKKATPLCESKIHLDLRNKIMTMINNYCEHDWRKGIHLFNDIYCTKCKQHFEVNNEA